MPFFIFANEFVFFVIEIPCVSKTKNATKAGARLRSSSAASLPLPVVGRRSSDMRSAFWLEVIQAPCQVGRVKICFLIKALAVRAGDGRQLVVPNRAAICGIF